MQQHLETVEISSGAGDSQALDRWLAFCEIAQCPLAGGSLSLVNRGELERRVAAEGRQKLDDGVIGAFVSEGAGRAFPIRGSVADFLEGDSLRLEAAPSPAVSPITTTLADVQPDDGASLTKDSVRAWYDEYGWRRNDSGMYNDSALFSQAAPVGHGLYELLSHFRPLERLTGGRWLIDAASGAIAHPEYLSYSWFFDRRVCVDFSATALLEAAGKLRPSDFCCQADITRLPFRTEAFHGGISGYTLQHIHESQQATALGELYRVQAAGAHLCVFTDVTCGSAHDTAWRTLRMVVRALKALGLFTWRSEPESRTEQTAPAPHDLYFHPRTAAWWRAAGTRLTPLTRVETLRLLARHEFHGLFGLSTRAVQWLRALESLFPEKLASSSAYCLVDLEKPAVDRR